MMSYQSKQMIVDALLKVVSAAPNSQMLPPYYFHAKNQLRPISNQDFATWLNYVNSILDISYNHTGLNNVLSTKANISQVSFQNNVSYEQRIERIKYEILNLVRSIL